MPGYVAKALERFKVISTHELTILCPSHQQYKAQHAHEQTHHLQAQQLTHSLLQQIVGVFLYLARCVDGLATISVNKLSSAQSTPTTAVCLT
jgi:hypothetical protein